MCRHKNARWAEFQDMISVNRNVLSRVRKVARDGPDVTSGGRQFHAWRPENQQPKMLGCQQWSGEPEAGRGSRRRKSEALSDLVGQQRKWTGQGTTVHSRGGPCVPGRQPWTLCVQIKSYFHTLHLLCFQFNISDYYCFGYDTLLMLSYWYS